jgi:transcriptional regulator with XRE-family HTH domain
LRRAAGLSGDRAAERTHMSQSKLSRIETARRLATTADVQALVHAYKADQAIAAKLLTLARSASREYRSVRADRLRGVERKQAELAAFEDAGKLIRHFLPAVPTGLLHTRAYAEATLRALDTVPVGSFDAVVDAKMARQQALRDPDTHWSFLMTETAVRARVAPIEVMAGQCAHMAQLAASGIAEIAIVPFAAQWPTMTLNTFVIYDDKFVTCELFSGEVVLHDEQDIAYHRDLFEKFRARAFTGSSAVAFLRAAADEYSAMSGQFMQKPE